eukprot:Lithocolla_globosa_v1_NODE_2369_length_2032_cov_10.238240.p1 type:complete len:247 gc:universal NODE_2369_length_2032_cov_10.238240:1154-414(-)
MKKTHKSVRARVAPRSIEEGAILMIEDNDVVGFFQLVNNFTVNNKPINSGARLSRSLSMTSKSMLAKIRGEIDLNYIGTKGSSMLHVASYLGLQKIVEFLVSEGADTQILDSSGNSCLHLAALGGHSVTLRYFLASKVIRKLVDTRNDLQESPLHLATEVNCVGALLDHGMSPLERNKNGDSPLDLSIIHHRSSVFKKIIHYVLPELVKQQQQEVQTSSPPHSPPSPSTPPSPTSPISSPFFLFRH